MFLARARIFSIFLNFQLCIERFPLNTVLVSCSHTIQSEHCSSHVTRTSAASNSTAFKSVVALHKPANQGTLFQSRDTHQPTREFYKLPYTQFFYKKLKFFPGCQFLNFSRLWPYKIILNQFLNFVIPVLRCVGLKVIDSRLVWVTSLLGFIYWLPNATVRYLKLILENCSL